MILEALNNPKSKKKNNKKDKEKDDKTEEPEEPKDNTPPVITKEPEIPASPE